MAPLKVIRVCVFASHMDVLDKVGLKFNEKDESILTSVTLGTNMTLLLT